MEKRKPSYNLTLVQRSIGSAAGLSITIPAFRDAQALGFDRNAIIKTVLEMTPAMFYKSMTTFANHRLWQDVYHVTAGDLVLYVKFQADIIAEFRIMSFKEL